MFVILMIEKNTEKTSFFQNKQNLEIYDILDCRQKQATFVAM